MVSTFRQSKEQRLMSFQSKVLTKTFRLKREETGGWRKLYKEELYNPQFTPHIIRVIKFNQVQYQKNRRKYCLSMVKGKAKVLPRTGHEGPEGE